MTTDEIALLLPGVFQRALRARSPLDALVALMSHLHEPSEARLAALDEVLDPRRAPEPFVRYLATWVGVPAEAALGVPQLRSLVALAAELARWSGTSRGLVAFLEVATGVRGFQVEDDVPLAPDAASPRKERGGPYYLRVRAPASLAPYRDVLDRIIAREKPVYVRHELVFS